MNRQDIVVLAVLIIVAFYVWTLPIQDNPLPFGEGDSAWHFSIGDYMHSSDRAIWRLPFYIGWWYYGFNQILGPFAPEYLPSNHLNYALMQFQGDRFVPVLTYRAISSVLGAFAAYFLIRRLYGFLIASVASFGLIFSLREFQIYLWGQQPTTTSFVIVPVLLYAMYRYVNSVFDMKPRPVYLLVMILLLTGQYFLHIQGMIVSLMTSFFYTLFMIAKHRRIPISRTVMIQLGIAAALVAAVTLPFAVIYLGAGQPSPEPRNYSRFLQWNVPAENVVGSYPAAFVQFDAQYFKWDLPFTDKAFNISLYAIIFATVILLLRRRPQDLLLISWLITIYITLHLDVILGSREWAGRIARMQIAEPPLFFPLIAIGVLSIPSLLRLPKLPRVISRYALAIGLCLLIYTTIGVQAKDILTSAYAGQGRITPEQMDAALWLNENTPEETFIYLYKLGQWQYPKIRWMLAASQRHVLHYETKFNNRTELQGVPYYIAFDYSDPLFTQNQRQKLIEAQQLENTMFSDSAPLYDRGNIRIYHVNRSRFV